MYSAKPEGEDRKLYQRFLIWRSICRSSLMALNDQQRVDDFLGARLYIVYIRHGRRMSRFVTKLISISYSLFITGY